MLSINRDRKKKKFINAGSDEPKMKKIKTESGNWVSASYKSGVYEKWKQKSKIEHQKQMEPEMDEDDQETIDAVKKRNTNIDNRKRIGKPGNKKPPRRELKSNEQIFKVRQKLEKKKNYQQQKTAQRKKKAGFNKK